VGKYATTVVERPYTTTQSAKPARATIPDPNRDERAKNDAECDGVDSRHRHTRKTAQLLRAAPHVCTPRIQLFADIADAAGIVVKTPPATQAMGPASSRRIGEIADHCLHQNSDHGVEDAPPTVISTPQRGPPQSYSPSYYPSEPPEQVGTGLGVTVVQSLSKQSMLLRLRLVDERRRSLYRDGFAIVPAAIMYHSLWRAPSQRSRSPRCRRCTPPGRHRAAAARCRRWWPARWWR
jgi:hypothetical protein